MSEVESIVKHWRHIIEENRKCKRDWFHGLPYRWWYGLSGNTFLKKLPQHLDRKKEPNWFKHTHAKSTPKPKPEKSPEIKPEKPPKLDKSLEGKLAVCVLYYYDRPLLRAFLSHYCHLKTVGEIIIQNQNWSDKDTLYLLKTVAEFIDKHGKKIVVLPSCFARPKGIGKRSQFKKYGQSKIRNRLQRFMGTSPWIMGVMDSPMYVDSYAKTDFELGKFISLSEERASKGLSTVGFVKYLCVWYDGIYPCNGIPIKRRKSADMRHRLFRFTGLFACRGGKVHDNSFDAYVKGEWVRVTPVGGTFRKTTKTLKHRWEFSVATNLKVLHYHTLIRKSGESVEYAPIDMKKLKQRDIHPKHYLNELPKKK